MYDFHMRDYIYFYAIVIFAIAAAITGTHSKTVNDKVEEIDRK